MKFLLSILGTLLVSNIVSAQYVDRETSFDNEALEDGFFENLVNSSLKNILNSMNDPLYMNGTNINSNTTALNGSLALSNISISGIHQLVASYIKVAVLNLAMNLTMDAPDLVVSATYNASMTLAELLPFYGYGNMSLTISGSQFNVSGTANLNSGFSISNASVGYEFGGLTVNLTGVYNNVVLSQLLSVAITDNIVPFLNNNEALISGIINGVLNGGTSIEEDISEVVEILVETLPQEFLDTVALMRKYPMSFATDGK